MEANLNEAGGDVISVYIRRTKDGLEVSFKVDPSIEEFFRRWGGGRVEDVRAIGGRLWKSEQPLSIWYTNNVNSRAYVLNQPGTPLFDDDSGSVNISFIQMVGASEGRKFVCDMVVSRNELERLRTQISTGLGTFYNDYIKPAHMQVVVATEPVRPQ